MPRRKESALDILITLPWWVSVLLSGTAYVGLRWVGPSVFGDNAVAAAFVVAGQHLAPWVAGFFILIAGGAALFAWRKRRLVDGQMSLGTIRDLHWQDFEWLVSEAYRRLGYSVRDSINRGPDGGVDLVLRKDGLTTLVQCKQRKSSAVGVPVVREAYGVQVHEKADRSVVITSGHFTREAITFAQGKPIELVDGPQLLVFVKDVQPRKEPAQNPPRPPLTPPSAPPPAPPAIVKSATSPVCPECGASMILRTAKRGANAGNRFWGCSAYPKCKRTAPVIASS
jgi:restriction system protein